jgi:predicted ATPase
MRHLRSVELRLPGGRRPARFPYTVPFAGSLERIDFTTDVTFLAGENGSGKSTFLEALACAIGSTTVGSESVTTDRGLAAIREFASHLKLTWSKRTKKGFFMRSEDFFGYARKMARIKAEMESDLRAIDDEYRGRSALAKDLARMPYKRELGEMQRAYGEGVDSRSHGEAFFRLFKERFVGAGLYLLDEPETPLSPKRQLALLLMLKTMVDQGGQFIVATHSPILLAYPGATILSFDGGAIRPVDYESTEHYTVTRTFLNNPEAYLKHLMQ